MIDRENQGGRMSPYSDYYSTGGGCQPPKKPRNSGATLAVLGMVLLCLAAAITIGRGRGARAEDRELPEARQEQALSTENAAFQEILSEESENPGETETAEPVRPTDVELVIGGSKTETMSLQEIYKKLIPSVASITAESGSARSTGTAIIMREDGYLITNYHVVSGAGAMTALLFDGTEYPAALVGGDETSDLAVLKIDAQGLTPAEFGSSDSVEVGDAVVAIGDPLGTELRGTMTDGIICGINRDVKVGDRTMTLLQTNAALNSGNSGGPLVNMAGQVIGVNTMKLSSSYNAVEGIGFAIPISTAGPLISELAEKGYVSGRPAFGFSVEVLSAQMRLFYDLPGALCIRSVMETSDAWAKGVSPGDIIVAVEGTPVSTMDEFNTMKNEFSAGDTVLLTLFRKGEELQVRVKLMDRADLD